MELSEKFKTLVETAKADFKEESGKEPKTCVIVVGSDENDKIGVAVAERAIEAGVVIIAVSPKEAEEMGFNKKFFIIGNSLSSLHSCGPLLSKEDFVKKIVPAKLDYGFNEYFNLEKKEKEIVKSQYKAQNKYFNNKARNNFKKR